MKTSRTYSSSLKPRIAYHRNYYCQLCLPKESWNRPRAQHKRENGTKVSIPKPTAAESQKLKQLAQQQQETRIAELIRSLLSAPPTSWLETFSMPPSPTSEAEKVQYTAATCLQVNDGKIISGTLKIITDLLKWELRC